jgi:hypothetical protein
MELATSALRQTRRGEASSSNGEQGAVSMDEEERGLKSLKELQGYNRKHTVSEFEYELLAPNFQLLSGSQMSPFTLAAPCSMLAAINSF